VRHTIRWTAEKIAQRLALIEPLVYRRHQPLAPFRYLVLEGPHTAPPVGLDVQDNQWSVVEPDTYWAGWSTDFTLRTHFTVPAEWPADAPVALHLPIGTAGDFSHPEALVCIDGTAYAACDRHHQEVLLPARWCDGRDHLLALHGWTGLGGALRRQPEHRLFMRPCAVVQIDQTTRSFLATARVALGIANALEAHSPARGHLLNALDTACQLLETREPFGEAFYASVPAAHAALKAGIGQAGPPLAVDIVATGHAHIDVAWLWTLGQTRRKASRTFHTVLRLMEQFPDYHFTQSQPQLYDFVQQDDPALFDGIKRRVAEGRWEPVGGMWLEADCNLSGPEALVRQFLLGVAFFREHFGPHAMSPVLWLPDAFGYPWSLPQLIKQAGLHYFFTIKLGWSQYNRLPYDSFWWQGLDGTRVLTHFSTTPARGNSAYASTYNAEMTPEQVLGTWTNCQQKELHHPLLMAFGYGDGGGGPTREMLENARELATFPATPRVQQASVAEFFRRLEAVVDHRLPTWNGELYLELHRGTYTTQSRTKRANRQSEFLLHDAEFLAALASVLDPQYHYPATPLRQAWQLVCLNQFHDIIPGSSIGPVYVESQQQYQDVKQLAEAAREQALNAIASAVGGELLIVNPTAFARHDLAFLSGDAPTAWQHPDGVPVSTQPVEGGVLIDAGELVPFSVTALTAPSTVPPAVCNRLTATPTLLENEFLRVEFSPCGDVVRIFDKRTGREVLPVGAIANQFQAFEDRPLAWDAWDVDIFYDDKLWVSDPATLVRVVESGPLRATLEMHRRILHSDYVQRISLCHNRARLDFETTIDWRERHILLKVAFPVDVLSPVATYDIQWGNVQRPTHRNTSWDWARFETCAHKWVDLSEGNYGVSLLNDCKYGHDIHNNVMRLSLLRSPTVPDPDADQGEHRFVYSLLPHVGSWGIDTVREAYALNDRLLVQGGKRQAAGERPLPGSPVSFIACSAANFVIETLKRAEDGHGLIMRGYECQRQRGPVTLTTGFTLRQAWRTNLLEEGQEPLTVDNNRVTIFVKPYEIVTVRLIPA
jgi:alpha-mannosidase